ncbi:MAG: hypothetical protein AB1791_12750 [Chloroflexota bacterium]
METKVPPKKSPRRKWLLIGVLVALVGCLCLATVAILSQGSRNSARTTASQEQATESQEQPAESASDSTAPPETTHTEEPEPSPTALPGLGIDVILAEVRWRILEAEDLGQTLASDNQFIDSLTTPGKFIKVRFEVENLGADLASSVGFDLVDDQGRTFIASTDVFYWIPEQENCFLVNLNPNVPKICTAIYEVAANAAGLKAKVGDLKVFGAEERLIDLELD